MKMPSFREPFPARKLLNQVGLNPEFFPLDQELANLSEEGQMVNILVFVGQQCLLQRLNSVVVRKQPLTTCGRMREAGLENSRLPPNHSLPTSVLDCSTTGFLMIPDFDAVAVPTIPGKY